MAGHEDAPRMGPLVSELEAAVANAPQRNPDPLLCFDLLTKLLVAVEHEPKDSLLHLQRATEEVLQTLLVAGGGARPPCRRLIASVMVGLIARGDSISVYSRVSSLQAWFSDKSTDKSTKPAAYMGAAQCLGAITRAHGQKLTSGMSETVSIVTKLMRSSEVGVRLAAMQLLQDAAEGTRGGGPTAAYVDAMKTTTRVGANDKSPDVRAAAAGCLQAFATAGSAGLAGGGLESLATLCVKSLEDAHQAVRDSFGAALGAIVALGLNPQAQVQPKGKGQTGSPKALDLGIQKYLVTPFLKAGGARAKDVRVGLAMAWVSFLQAMRLTYGTSDFELPPYALQAMGMLNPSVKATPDVHAQACVVYILRAGVVEQMGEGAQRELLKLLAKQLSADGWAPTMLVVVLRTLAHLVATLGEVTRDDREVLDDPLLNSFSSSSAAVRVEAALAVRALAMVDPSCAMSLMSCSLTALRAHREALAGDKVDRMRGDIEALHGQAVMLAALLSATPKLPLGVPSSLPDGILGVARRMVLHASKSPAIASAEREAGWTLIAALVVSLPPEELEEHELELMTLWALPFGGNCVERVKDAVPNLALELSGWAAAMEALEAFIRSHVAPSMSPDKDEILLTPILGYLNGALTYLSSPVLQDAPAGIRPLVDQLVLRTLDAYRALPDPSLYRGDHVTLLAICCAPFRDPVSYVASSCLRKLLDERDASLGPWVPGRDGLEDELRAFSGGSDGPLPPVTQAASSVFPQPKSQATALVDSMLLTFAAMFPAQAEKVKVHLLETVLTSLKGGKKQPWRAPNALNACVALLGSLKAQLAHKGVVEKEEDLWKRSQLVIQGVLAADPASSAARRSAAEVLGLLARLGDDSFTARLVRSLLTDAQTVTEAPQRAAICLALGCIRRSVGGMALSALVPNTVQVLCTLARDPSEGLHIWALHALWLTADAAGLSYIPHVQATLTLVMEVLLSDEHSSPGLSLAAARLVNAMVAVLGPELSPSSSVFSRCKSVVSDTSASQEPAAQLECVLYTQQLVLFAPQAVPLHVHTQTLRATLSSRQPSLRRAAVATLRHMSERDPALMVDERIEEDLFAMLDNETDERIVRDVCLTLERLLEAAAPSCPSRWLRLCRNVVLAASATRKAGEDKGAVAIGPSTALLEGGNSTQEGGIGEDDEAGIMASSASSSSVKSAPGGGAGPPGQGKAKDVDQLPRFRTRLFAARCLSRLPSAAGNNAAHFDLVLAREERARAAAEGQPGGDWLVCHLAELVALAYQVATGTMETVRPIGIALLDTIIHKFAKTEDPEYDSHLLLEQYQAQLLSTLRISLDHSAAAPLLTAAARLGASIITSGIAGGDRGMLQRVITLMCGPLAKWQDLSNSSYAEWVGAKVRLSLLAAHADVACFALTAPPPESEPPPLGDSTRHSDASVVRSLLGNLGGNLTHLWVGLLRDFAVLCTQPGSVQALCAPFLLSAPSPTAGAAIKPQLEQVWLTVLRAATSEASLDPKPARRGGSFSEAGGKEQKLLSSINGSHSPAAGAEGAGAGGGGGGDVGGGGGATSDEDKVPRGAVNGTTPPASSSSLSAFGADVDVQESVLSSDEYRQVWGLCMFALWEGPPGASSGDATWQHDPSWQNSAADGSDEAVSWGDHAGGSGFGQVAGQQPTLNDNEARLLVLTAVKHLCGAKLCRSELLSLELCRELLRTLLDAKPVKSSPLAHEALVVDILTRVVTGVPEDYMRDQALVLSAAELAVALLHRLLIGLSGHQDDSQQSTLGAITTLLASFAARLDPEAQGLLVPQLLCVALKLLQVAAPGSPTVAAAATLVTSLGSIVSPSVSGQGGGGLPVDEAGWAGQRPSVMASLIESLAQMVDRLLASAARLASLPEGAASESVSRRTSLSANPSPSPSDGVRALEDDRDGSSRRSILSPTSPTPVLSPSLSSSFRRSGSRQETAAEVEAELAHRLPAVIGLLAVLAPCVPRPGGDFYAQELSEMARERGLSCLRAALASQKAVQVAALQALRLVLQEASVETPPGAKKEWALLCMRHLAADVTSLVLATCQEPMSMQAASSVMESLKLLLLLHAVVQDDEKQTAVVQILLPTAIAAATPHPSGPSQGQVAISAMVVKLVQRLASSVPAQLQAAAGALSLEAKTQLQAIIRASAAQQLEAASAPVPPKQQMSVTPVTLTVPLGKGLVPPPPGTIAPPPGLFAPPPPGAGSSSLLQKEATRAAPPVVPPVSTPLDEEGEARNKNDDDDDDDDWDDFQSIRTSAPSSAPSAAPAAPAAAAAIDTSMPAQEELAPAEAPEGLEGEDGGDEGRNQGRGEEIAGEVEGEAGPASEGGGAAGARDVAAAPTQEEEEEEDDDDWDAFQDASVTPDGASAAYGGETVGGQGPDGGPIEGPGVSTATTAEDEVLLENHAEHESADDSSDAQRTDGDKPAGSAPAGNESVGDEPADVSATTSSAGHQLLAHDLDDDKAPGGIEGEDRAGEAAAGAENVGAGSLPDENFVALDALMGFEEPGPSVLPPVASDPGTKESRSADVGAAGGGDGEGAVAGAGEDGGDEWDDFQTFSAAAPVTDGGSAVAPGGGVPAAGLPEEAGTGAELLGDLVAAAGAAEVGGDVAAAGEERSEIEGAVSAGKQGGGWVEATPGGEESGFEVVLGGREREEEDEHAHEAVSLSVDESTLVGSGPGDETAAVVGASSSGSEDVAQGEGAHFGAEGSRVVEEAVEEETGEGGTGAAEAPGGAGDAGVAGEAAEAGGEGNGLPGGESGDESKKEEVAVPRGASETAAHALATLQLPFVAPSGLDESTGPTPTIPNLPSLDAAVDPLAGSTPGVDFLSMPLGNLEPVVQRSVTTLPTSSSIDVLATLADPGDGGPDKEVKNNERLPEVGNKLQETEEEPADVSQQQEAPPATAAAAAAVPAAFTVSGADIATAAAAAVGGGAGCDGGSAGGSGVDGIVGEIGVQESTPEKPMSLLDLDKQEGPSVPTPGTERPAEGAAVPDLDMAARTIEAELKMDLDPAMELLPAALEGGLAGSDHVLPAEEAVEVVEAVPAREEMASGLRLEDALLDVGPPVFDHVPLTEEAVPVQEERTSVLGPEHALLDGGATEGQESAEGEESTGAAAGSKSLGDENEDDH